MADISGSNIWDIDSRSKTSAFAWRGQFTPDFVSLVFDKFDTGKGRVLDPFMGSGTVLLEALRRDRSTIGSEINPAAYYLSKVFTLANLEDKKRYMLLGKVLEGMNDLKSDHLGNFFNDLANLAKGTEDQDLNTLLIALLLLSAKNGSHSSSTSLRAAYSQIEKIVMDLPATQAGVEIYCADARSIQAEDSSVGFVVTSPPYINVFNYHQNYRPAIEALGWNVLEKAKSEIGSNRKHRSNRLLTVIQYTLDMAMLLDELSRLLMHDGVVVMVVGRESNVRGLPFMNSEIIEEAIGLFPEFKMEEKHERKFRSRYGALVFEDILVFKKTQIGRSDPRSIEEVISQARGIAVRHLERVKNNAPAEVFSDLVQAISNSESVLPSPLH